VTDTATRTRELRKILDNEMARNAHESAVRILKQLRNESCPRSVRVQYWQTLYDRAKSLGYVDRQLECLDNLRREESRA
jgi:hypothetical protein